MLDGASVVVDVVVVLVVVVEVLLLEVVLCTMRSVFFGEVKLALLEKTCLGSIAPSERLLNAIMEFVRESECTGLVVGDCVDVVVVWTGVTAYTPSLFRLI